jgi:hypothetical protein
MNWNEEKRGGVAQVLTLLVRSRARINELRGIEEGGA